MSRRENTLFKNLAFKSSLDRQDSSSENQVDESESENEQAPEKSPVTKEQPAKMQKLNFDSNEPEKLVEKGNFIKEQR